MTTRRNIVAHEGGAAAVEFALVASMLIMTILFVMCVGIILYLNQAMDLAVTKAGRQIMIGAVQTAGTSRNDFRVNYICANLPSVFDCSKLVVNVQTVTQAARPGGYYGLLNSSQTALTVPTSGTAQYSLGSQQSYEYLQVVYPITFLPTVIALLLGGGATSEGAQAVMLVSTATFRNEQY